MYNEEYRMQQSKLMDQLAYEKSPIILSNEYSETLKEQYNMRQKNKISLLKQCLYITLSVYIIAIIISIPFIRFNSDIYFNGDLDCEIIKYNIDVAIYYFGLLLIFSCIPSALYVVIRYYNYKTIQTLPQVSYADVCVKLANCKDEKERLIIKSFMRSINDYATKGKEADSQTLEALQISLSNICRENS